MSDGDPVDADRRPLASRDTGWARAVARWLATTPITPNAISMGSVLFAGVAGLAFAALDGASGGARIGLLLLATLGCQLRLLCNLFDGMVAIEGGKRTADGAVWNELPDRLADVAVLVGLGVGIGEPALGWAAGALAVIGAYVRELGHGIDGVVDFGGPLAKPQRMALVSGAAVLSLLEALWNGQGGLLLIALWLVAAGTLLTGGLRTLSLIRRLKRPGE